MTWPPKNGEVPKPYHSKPWPQPSHSQQKDDQESQRAQQSTRGCTERKDSVCRLVSSDMVTFLGDFSLGFFSSGLSVPLSAIRLKEFTKKN